VVSALLGNLTDKNKASMIKEMQKLPIYLGLFVLVLSLPVSVFLTTQKAILVGQAALEKKAQLWLQPSQLELSRGEEAQVKVLLDTKKTASAGVDLVLKYNPQAVKVMDNLIKPGTVFNYYRDRLVDNRRGLIRLSSKGKFSGQGVFAVFTVRAINLGQSKIEIITPKKSVDAAAVWNESGVENILGSVGNLSINVH